MIVNTGKPDRVIRIILGIVLLVLAFTNIVVLGSSLKTILIVVGIVMLITGLTGFCALYKVLGINTCRR